MMSISEKCPKGAGMLVPRAGCRCTATGCERDAECALWVPVGRPVLEGAHDRMWCRAVNRCPVGGNGILDLTGRGFFSNVFGCRAGGARCTVRTEYGNGIVTAGRPFRDALGPMLRNERFQGHTGTGAELAMTMMCGRAEGKIEKLTAELMIEISRRKKAEEAMKACEGRYRRLLDAVTDYVYTVTIIEDRPVSTSHGPGCVAVTGYTSEEYEADPYLWFRMIHEEDREAVTLQAERVLSGDATPFLEHRIIHKDGSIRWVKNRPVQHFDAAGRLLSYDGLIKDITERKRLEEELYQSQKLESIGRLAGGVAHDFNNYLSAIIGFAELSVMQLKTDDVICGNLRKIQMSAHKAAGVARQLLAFSRKQIIEPRTINLNDSIRSFSRILAHLIGEDIEVATYLDPELGSVRADPLQIEQTIINLSVNARDAMPGGGKIFIETANIWCCGEDARRQDIPPGRYVMMAVRDTGTGVPRHVLPHIFEPFFTTKGKDLGTGLGLSTVYGIVGQHMGRILVESEEGKGTTFRIYLPRIDEEPEVSHEKSGTHEFPRGAETVLLVEDDDVVRDYASQLLKLHGYTVLEASDGREALSVCQRCGDGIDLIMTDVVMPNMSGHELIARLRGTLKDCRVLYMSGYVDEVLSRRDLSEGKIHLIRKPFVSLDLLKKVREVLDE